MIPILRMDLESDRQRVEALVAGLRLNAADLALGRGKLSAASESVKQVMADVAERGDAAVVEASRRFDDPGFTPNQIRIPVDEMRQAAGRVPHELRSAIRHAIAQVREYQSHIMPKDAAMLERPGAQLGMRFTPLDSAGLYFPGGKAAYPSSLIMLAVPAQVAGVKRLVACTPPSQYGKSDLVLAACHELGLKDVFRANGVAAIAAMAFGTETIPAVDKIVGPGGAAVQLAKRLVSGAVGLDGFLGPSEVVVIADDSGDAEFIAADLLAQAEHDPGSAFLLTTSDDLARRVAAGAVRQFQQRHRQTALDKALREHSAIVVDESMDRLVELANRLAAEHVNLQVRDEQGVLAKLTHAGAVFVGRYAPIAAGDYVAGPSHCLPTNTTARFSSGVSVYEFLKRSSIVHYQEEGLKHDAAAIVAMAGAEHLDAHAASVRIRMEDK